MMVEQMENEIQPSETKPVSARTNSLSERFTNKAVLMALIWGSYTKGMEGFQKVWATIRGTLHISSLHHQIANETKQTPSTVGPQNWFWLRSKRPKFLLNFWIWGMEKKKKKKKFP